MLSVQLSVSIWWFTLALIPLAVVILAASAFLPAQGRLHNVYERAVSTILFYPGPGAQVTFIQSLLALLGVIALALGTSVYNDGQRDVPSTMPLNTQLMVQAKGWRNQRNLYLTCLALALWWSVYATFAYKARIARLLKKIDDLEQAGNSSSSAVNNKAEASSVRQRLPNPSAPAQE